jgi:hypothetical protein
VHITAITGRVLLPVARYRLLPAYTAGRALIMALRIAMMMVRNKFQSNMFRSPPYQFWSVSMVDTVNHHAGFAINTAMSENFFSLIEKFKKGRGSRRPLPGIAIGLPGTSGLSRQGSARTSLSENRGEL